MFSKMSKQSAMKTRRGISPILFHFPIHDMRALCSPATCTSLLVTHGDFWVKTWVVSEGREIPSVHSDEIRPSHHTYSKHIVHDNNYKKNRSIGGEKMEERKTVKMAQASKG